MLASILLADIARIQLYINRNKKTLAQIKAEYAANGEKIKIINGGLFNRTSFKPDCHLNANGECLSVPPKPYSCWLYQWNDTTDFGMYFLPLDKRIERLNGISCCTLITPSGKEPKLYYDAPQGGSRGRSAIGTKDGQVMLYCTPDGGKDQKTPEQLRDYLYSLGWETAVMLDSGGSCQCSFGDGQSVYSSRIVHNFIVLVLKDSVCPYPEPTQSVRYGNVGRNVRWLQWNLNTVGYNCGSIDGLFGLKTKTALMAFQKMAGLVQDGVCGPLTKAAIRRKINV